MTSPRSGHAIVLVSDEFDELLDHCDRILVMNQGQIVEELRPPRPR